MISLSGIASTRRKQLRNRSPEAPGRTSPGEKARRKLTETLDDESSFEPAAPRDTPIARLDLERAIASLPPGCREAFVLHDVEGFDHKEVAGLLGIAEGTSKSQVFKARTRLRGLLK